MSGIIASLLNRIQEVHQINESIKTAEKAKIFVLKSKAKKIFDVLFSSLLPCIHFFINYFIISQECLIIYTNSKEVTNTSINFNCNQHAEAQILLAEAAFYTESYETCRSLLEVVTHLIKIFK